MYKPTDWKKLIIPPYMTVSEFTLWRRSGVEGRLTTVDETNHPAHILRRGETPRRPFTDEIRGRPTDIDRMDRYQQMVRLKREGPETTFKEENNFTQH